MKIKLLIVLLTGLMLGFCSIMPPISDPIPTSQDSLPATKPADVAVYQSGIASWYGRDFHGKRTANGEIYDMYKLTAAHRTLPFNTFVEVENLENNHKIVVRINDRGPFVKDRIIDLSLIAAQKIEMEDQGTARVALKIIKPAEQMPQLNRISHGNGGFYLQAGAFSVKKNAFRLLKQVRRLFPRLDFSIYFKGGFYKIISKEILSRDKAEDYRNRLGVHGIATFIKQHQ
jgi:rare lipoprotein A